LNVLLSAENNFPCKVFSVAAPWNLQALAAASLGHTPPHPTRSYARDDYDRRITKKYLLFILYFNATSIDSENAEHVKGNSFYSFRRD
jgi:hypothetical protein